MKNKKACLLGLIAASVFFGQAIFAAEVANQAVSEQPTVAKGEMTILADINFRSPILLKQESTKLDIYFRLENNFPKSEAGIRYGVQLIKDKTIVDEKVFTDDVLSVEGNNSIQKIFSYTLPSHLSGQFEIWLVAKNESGLPLALFKLEKPVVLNGTGEYLEINNKSCNLKIEGDKNKMNTAGKDVARGYDKTYSLMQGVSLRPEETLNLRCELISHFKEAVTVSPIYNTFERSLFGNPVDRDRKVAEIVLQAGEKKTFDLKVEKPKFSQAYEVKLAFFRTDLEVAAPIIFHYVVAGESATIQKLDLDKVSYKKGETIKANLLWTGSADNFESSRVGKTENNPILLSLDISNQANQKCADNLEKTLEPNSQETKLALTAKIDCSDPMVKVVLKNKQGTILAQKEFNYLKNKEVVPQQPGASKSKNNGLVVALGLIFVFIVVLILFFLKKKKIIMMTGLLWLVVSALFGLGFQRADALTTLSANGGTWGSSTATVNLDKSIYNPGENMTITSSGSWWVSCANVENWTTLSVTSPSQCVSQLISKGNSQQDFGVGSKICATESTPGSHSVNFKNELFGECYHGSLVRTSANINDCANKSDMCSGEYCNPMEATTQYYYSDGSACYPSDSVTCDYYEYKFYIYSGGRNYAMDSGSIAYTVADNTPNPTCAISFSSGSYNVGAWGPLTWSSANATGASLYCSIGSNVIINGGVPTSYSGYGIQLTPQGTVYCVLTVTNGSKSGTCRTSASVATACTPTCTGDAGCYNAGSEPWYTAATTTSGTCCDGKKCYYCWTGNWSSSLNKCINRDCNIGCTNNNECATNYCDAASGKCRLASNPTSTTCTGATNVCTGSIPSDSTMCSGDNIALTATLPWRYVGASSLSCTVPIKCEYYTAPPPPSGCRGACSTDSDCSAGLTCYPLFGCIKTCNGVGDPTCGTCPSTREPCNGVCTDTSMCSYPEDCYGGMDGCDGTNTCYCRNINNPLDTKCKNVADCNEACGLNYWQPDKPGYACGSGRVCYSDALGRLVAPYSYETGSCRNPLNPTSVTCNSGGFTCSPTTQPAGKTACPGTQTTGLSSATPWTDKGDSSGCSGSGGICEYYTPCSPSTTCVQPTCAGECGLKTGYCREVCGGNCTGVNCSPSHDLNCGACNSGNWHEVAP